MENLPDMSYTGGLRQFSISQFAGYNHRISAQNGYIWDMNNLCGSQYPVLSSRPPRWTVKSVAKPNGLYCMGKLFLVDGTTLSADGQEIGQVADSKKQMQGMSGRLIIWPDKLIYTKEGVLESLEASYTAQNLVFCDGTYADQEAKANTIKTTGDPFPFNVGDGVTISGCTAKPGNNKTVIVREISEDKKSLQFYENTFDLGDGTSVTETVSVTLARTVPDMDFICGNENRLWGCKGDTIYACKLGDPYNWNVFEGLSTDAYSVETGSAGDFTACVSFLGYPVFFKEDRVFKVYGDKPTNFQVMASATLGVLEGANKTLAVAGETLYYLSRAGIVAYSGGIPRSISSAFGDVQYRGGVAGSDGVRYFVSLEDQDGVYSLFCYDTSVGAWYKEDNTKLIDAGYLGGLYGLTENSLVLLGDPITIPEGSKQESGIVSWVEFGDITLDGFDSKYPIRLRLRVAGEEGVTVTSQVQYDDGDWMTVEAVNVEKMKPFYLAFPVKRCDHFRLKLMANGPWKLWSLVVELYDGQYVRK